MKFPNLDQLQDHENVHAEKAFNCSISDNHENDETFSIRKQQQSEDEKNI